MTLYNFAAKVAQLPLSRLNPGGRDVGDEDGSGSRKGLQKGVCDLANLVFRAGGYEGLGGLVVVGYVQGLLSVHVGGVDVGASRD